MVVLAGCKSRQIATKNLLTTPADKVYTAEHVVNQVVKLQKDLSFVNIARAETNISFNGRNFYVVSNIKMIKSKEIVVSISVAFGLEIFRVQILPSGLYIFDRFHRQYTQISYDDLTKMLGIKVSFNIIESLLTNRIFTFSDTDIDKAFSVVQLPDKYILAANQKVKNFTHFFDVLPDFLLSATALNDDSVEVLSVNYSNFNVKHNISFPMKIELRANLNEKNMVINFDIKKIEFNKKFEIAPLNISSYKKMDFTNFIQ